MKLAHKFNMTETQLLHWMLPIMLIMIIYTSPPGLSGESGGEVSSEAQADREAVAPLDAAHHAHHDHLHLTTWSVR